jgi:hypothetical protein
MRRYITLALLTVALGVPALKADDHERDRVKVQRYYDRDHRDWHDWNDNEGRAYRYYLQQQKLREIEWRRANRRQQLEYWRWRHSNPDNVIFRLDVR